MDHRRGGAGDREDSPDSVGYIEGDHPLRRELAAQSIKLLQLPINERSRNVSVSSSVTDLEAPMYSTSNLYSRERATSGKQGVRTISCVSGLSFSESLLVWGVFCWLQCLLQFLLQRLLQFFFLLHKLAFAALQLPLGTGQQHFYFSVL